MIRFDIGKFFPADDGDEEKQFRKWLDNLKDASHVPAGIMSEDALMKGLVYYCGYKSKDVNAKECVLCDNKYCSICYLYNYCRKLEMQIQIMYNRFSRTHAVFVCKKCGADVFIEKAEAKTKKYCQCRYCDGGRMYRKPEA